MTGLSKSFRSFVFPTVSYPGVCVPFSSMNKNVRIKNVFSEPENSSAKSKNPRFDQ